MSRAFDASPCPCCGARDAWQAPDKLLACRRCRLIYTRDPITTVTYDADYVAARYPTYERPGVITCSRADRLQSVLGITTPTVLDVGVGDGSFVREGCRRGWQAYGYDINPERYEGVRWQPLPGGDGYRGMEYDCITFFDSLEHFEALEPVKAASCFTDYVMLSLPYPPPGWPWSGLHEWKHYRPGEHHLHFCDTETLEWLFEGRTLFIGFPEDAVRGRLDWGGERVPNILTVVLELGG